MLVESAACGNIQAPLLGLGLGFWTVDIEDDRRKKGVPKEIRTMGMNQGELIRTV